MPNTSAAKPASAATGMTHDSAARIVLRNPTFSTGIVTAGTSKTDLGPDELDHLLAGDGDGFLARSDDPCVGVADDVGEHVRAAGSASNAGMLRTSSCSRSAAGRPSRSAVAVETSVTTWSWIASMSKISVATARLAEGENATALQPPATGRDREQDRGNEEEEPGQSTPHFPSLSKITTAQRPARRGCRSHP